MRQIVFATNNENKLQEVRQILENKIEVLGLKDINFDEDIPETEETIEGNATLKANFIYQRFGLNCFADDTGLEIKTLNGEPGVFSARYAGEDCNSENNIDKVLSKMTNLTNRNARFKTIIAYVENGNIKLFEGVVNGNITTVRRGKDGFGYDSIFQPKGYKTTFAEMTKEEKNRISHRAKAIEKFSQYIGSYSKSNSNY